MFGWLKRAKPAHPLADLDQTRALLAALPGGDPVKALDRIAVRLDSINQAREVEFRQRWAVIELLALGASTHHRKLAQEFIAIRSAAKVDEGRMWDAAHTFWKMLAAAYLQLIDHCRAAGASSHDFAPNGLGLIARRALRASGQQLKWVYLRHGWPEERLWRELGSASLFAENAGVAEQRGELYPGMPGQSSAHEELLRALMLAMASPHNLAPVKLHLAERVVARLSGRFVLKQSPAPECGFSFDLALAHPPGRMHPGAAGGTTARYFGPGDAMRALTELIQEVRASSGIPRDLDLAGAFDQDGLVAVLSHLERVWDSAPPVRRAARSDLAARVTVVPGLPNILRGLEWIANGRPLDPEAFLEQESWTVFDRSDGGYGVLVPEERGSFVFDPLTGVRTAGGDWLRIGALVALREAQNANWRIGVVRRIAQSASGQRRAGIEMLDGVAMVVRLAPASGPRANEPERRRAAVLLSPTAEANDEARVLLRAGHYAPTHELVMHLGERRSLLQPAGLIEAGEDFDCARYKMFPA